jgi:hypothetical protein
MMQNLGNLAAILADMVRSALAWEQEHGASQHDNRKIEPPKPLTTIGVTDTLNASGNEVKGENNDHHD